MTGMEHAIEHAARIIRDGDPEGMGYAQAHNIASALASDGLLAPVQLREEWGSSDQSDMNMEPELRDEPAGWWSYVDTDAEGMAREHAGRDGKVWRRLVSDWLPVDPAEGDGSADCGCADCHTGLFPIMHLCADCGSKRCPRAARHDNPCGGSADQ